LWSTNKVNILFVSTGDNGGASYWQADAINKYTDHQARSIRIAQSYIGYPYDILNPSAPEIMKWGEWADVIHIRDGAPICLDRLKDKQRLITFTGMSYRKKAAVIIPHYRKLGYTVCVSTADLLAYYPTSPPIWIPNPRELMERDEPFSEFTVCHAPTYRERKGTEAVIEACKLAKVCLELLERKTYYEVMTIKSRCHLLVDQFAYGYGNNAIEAWALGLPVISNGSRKLLPFISERFGGRFPFAQCAENPKELAALIVKFRDNLTFYQGWANTGREYFLQHHHAPVVAKRLAKLYEGAKK
jgi:glycosyltransferase involved in cell wall biosynthesis